ncbi:unnamed protein product [Echinostoma caproni]|uniref:Flocculation protein FLO11-like n=1 Tax=Echinostoma caproni TaxID=27848 RepID=A0A183A6D7_9TREM|nr:unnamed protein product [Echinostoma caproni]
MPLNGSSTNRQLTDSLKSTTDTGSVKRTPSQSSCKFDVKRIGPECENYSPGSSKPQTDVRKTRMVYVDARKPKKKRVNVSTAPIYTATTSIGHGSRAHTWSTAMRRLKSAEHSSMEDHIIPTSPGAQSFGRNMAPVGDDTIGNSSGDHTSYLSGLSVTKFQPVDAGELHTNLKKIVKLKDNMVYCLLIAINPHDRLAI